jgi:hypothetical protein
MARLVARLDPNLGWQGVSGVIASEALNLIAKPPGSNLEDYDKPSLF